MIRYIPNSFAPAARLTERNGATPACNVIDITRNVNVCLPSFCDHGNGIILGENVFSTVTVCCLTGDSYASGKTPVSTRLYHSIRCWITIEYRQISNILNGQDRLIKSILFKIERQDYHLAVSGRYGVGVCTQVYVLKIVGVAPVERICQAVAKLQFRYEFEERHV